MLGPALSFRLSRAKEIGRHSGWKDKVWSRRYQGIVITDEEAQVARLEYVLAHGVKADLVARVEEWPGVHCAVPLLTGADVEGTWYDRTLEYNAFLRGKKLEKREAESRERIHLSPLPCWKHLSEEAYRARIADLVQEINKSGAAARAESQIAPLGAEGVRAQNPETRPRKIKKSLAPFCHAMRKKFRKALWDAYGWFVAAYRDAAEKLRSGDRNAEFPLGSFPPQLPFVPA